MRKRFYEIDDFRMLPHETEQLELSKEGSSAIAYIIVFAIGLIVLITGATLENITPDNYVGETLGLSNTLEVIFRSFVSLLNVFRDLIKFVYESIQWLVNALGSLIKSLIDFFN